MLMRKLIFTFLLGTISLFAQEKLVVEYEYTNEFDLSNLTDKEDIQMYKDAAARKTEFQLIVDKNESVYKGIEKINNSQEGERSSFSFVDPRDIYYKNISNNETLKFNDYNGRKFIIKDTISVLPWSLTRETSKILGYEVKKATAIVKNKTYEAWYSTKLAFKSGPSEFGGLPGLILKLVITTDSKKLPRKDIYQVIILKTNDKIKIEKPTKGEVVTKEEFKKITDKMLQDMIKSANDKMDKKID